MSNASDITPLMDHSACIVRTCHRFLGLRFAPGVTKRVALAYSLPEDAAGPRLVRGHAELRLASILANLADFGALPRDFAPPSPVVPSPSLGTGAAGRVLGDGDALQADPERTEPTRARLDAGTVVVITGPKEQANGKNWWPV